MSLDTFKTRMADNVAGMIYVGDQCLDCGLCRETAPANFARNGEGGYSYVKKQPETPEELAACREAMAGCCTETIFDDGDSFDWAALPAPTPYHLTLKGQAWRAHWRKIMRLITRLTLLGFTCVLLTGCQTPQERVVGQMEKMQQTMDEMQRKLDAMELEMSTKLK